MPLWKINLKSILPFEIINNVELCHLLLSLLYQSASEFERHGLGLTFNPRGLYSTVLRFISFTLSDNLSACSPPNFCVNLSSFPFPPSLFPRNLTPAPPSSSRDPLLLEPGSVACLDADDGSAACWEGNHPLPSNRRVCQSIRANVFCDHAAGKEEEEGGGGERRRREEEEARGRRHTRWHQPQTVPQWLPGSTHQFSSGRWCD